MAAGARTPPHASSTASAEAVVAGVGGGPGRGPGKPLREIAVDLYGREQVDADWHADSRMRLKLRRLVQRARAASGGAVWRQRSL